MTSTPREFTIDEWHDLADMLRAYERTHEGATKAELEQEAEKLEQTIRDSQECASRRTVQLGRMSATDLKCMRQRRGHGERHGVARHFLDVRMTAEWDGEFEE